MAMGIFQSIDWLTKKIKKLCCWLGVIEEYTGANLPYVEFIYERTSIYPTVLDDYNNGVFQIGGTYPSDFASFTSLVVGDTIIHRVYGSAGNLQLTSYFSMAKSVIELNDPFGLIKEINSHALNENSTQKVYLPNVTIVGDFAFRKNNQLTTIYLPKCTQLGSTVGNNDVFQNISGQNILLKINPSLLTCNSGAPDGDIQYLQSYNTVVII